MLDEGMMAGDTAKRRAAAAPRRRRPAPRRPGGRGLGTSYRPPEVPAFAVARDRLISLLDPGVQQRVTIVVAPPGYGKTVLLSQWAATHPRRRVRWLTLESEDNEATRFAHDLCEALGFSTGTLAETVRAGLDTDDQDAVSAFFAALLAELERSPPATVLLDDFHLLSNPALLDGLGTVIEHLPPWIHVVLSTRIDPPLRGYRLRLSDAFVELRQEDLAFQREEATQLVRRLADRDLTGTQIDALMSRTGGWAVGLQLAAVSLRQRRDVEQFVETFAADDRHVADYLTEHVLRHQPDATRRFLLSTSVLNHMSGALCDFVTGASGGQAMLDELERTSMFITRLDGRNGWFRYHQLFRALLRQHLREEDPTGERLLLHRAAEWHLAYDDPDTAVDYLAEAGAWEEVLDAAFAYGDALFSQGRAATVVRWVERVPRVVWRGRSHVLLLQAAASIVAGDRRRARENLDAIDALASATAADGVMAHLLRARFALQEGGAPRAVAAADRVLHDVDNLADAELPQVLGIIGTRRDVTAAARHTRGVALWCQGKAAARACLESVLGGEGHAVWEVSALGSLALCDAWSGLLTSGDQLAARALSLARQLELDHQSVTTDAYIALTHVARERDQLAQAATFLEEAARSASPSRRPIAASLVGTERAMLALAMGGPEDGLAVLAAHRVRTHPAQPPAIRSHRQAVEARLLTMIGDFEGAERALDLASDDTADIAAARVHLSVERRDAQAARAVVARWPGDPEPRARAERLLWAAILDHLDGDDATARRNLATVVAAAEAERNIGLFRAAGRHALGPARVLYRAAPTAFLRALVDRLAETATRRPGPANELVEPLTERELVVLTLLPTRMPNDEIAQRLGVSLNTLKTHLKHIYRKFGVTGRGDVVTAAERMHLL
jgi:LuxR family transcriptional regulator, maltose regulon positive regulatory protein